jgi:biotin carboxyl carrier protein
MRKVYYVANPHAKLQVVFLDDEHVEIDGVVSTFRFEPSTDGTYLLVLDGVTYRVVDLSGARANSGDLQNSSLLVSINGRELTLTVDDEQSLRLKSMLATQQTESGSLTLCAPMPGLVTRIEVSAGQSIAEDDGLLILEAMKMENEIRSSRKGVVREIHVVPGAAVEKGAPLVTIDY